MPNYNHARFLPACLAAIAGQSVPAREIIVVDDASTDNSVAVLQELARQYPTLRIYRNEVNQGFMGAVNRGISLATGDFLCLPGADDEIMPGLFEKSLRLLAEHPQAGLCASICRMVDLESNLSYNFGVHVSDQPCYLPPEKVFEYARAGRLIISSATTVWRRDALGQAGNYHAGLRWHCDWFAMFALAFRYGLCFVPEVLGEFRSSPGSVSNSGKRQGEVQREVLRYALEILEREENRDIAPKFRHSGMLAPFGKEMFGLIVGHRRYWKNLTATYLRHAVWWTLRIEAKKILPRSVARVYYKLAGVSGEGAS